MTIALSNITAVRPLDLTTILYNPNCVSVVTGDANMGTYINMAFAEGVSSDDTSYSGGIWVKSKWRFNNKKPYSIQYKVRITSNEETGCWGSGGAFGDNTDDNEFTWAQGSTNVQICNNTPWLNPLSALTLAVGSVYDIYIQYTPVGFTPVVGTGTGFQFWLCDSNRNPQTLLQSYSYVNESNPSLVFVGDLTGYTDSDNYYDPTTCLQFGSILISGELCYGLPVFAIGLIQNGMNNSYYTWDTTLIGIPNNLGFYSGPETGGGKPNNSCAFLQMGGGFTVPPNSSSTPTNISVPNMFLFMGPTYNNPTYANVFPAGSSSWKDIETFSGVSNLRLLGSTRSGGTLKVWVYNGDTNSPITGLSQTGGIANGDGSFTPLQGAEQLINLSGITASSIYRYVTISTSATETDHGLYATQDGPPVIQAADFLYGTGATTTAAGTMIISSSRN